MSAAADGRSLGTFRSARLGSASLVTAATRKMRRGAALG